jgi:CRP-like cAMP-binding protein
VARLRRDAFIDHLAEVPLFSALSKKDLQMVARRAEDVKVDAGKVLVSEGSAGTEFFVIVDGKARVTMRGRKVARASSSYAGLSRPITSRAACSSFCMS